MNNSGKFKEISSTISSCTFFARATFSEDVDFLNSYFSTANLAFRVALSIGYLVINPTTNTGVLHHSQNIFIKYHKQNYLLNNMKRFSFWGV